MSSKPSIAFIFVIDPPALTLETLLISASFRRHLPDADLIAYCPESKVDHVPRQLREYLDENGTGFATMPTEDVFSPPYKHGNKLIAGVQPRPHDFTVFLDTDTVIWQPFDTSELVAPNTVLAAPEGRYTWGKQDGHWEQAYRVFGMEVPEERIRLARTRQVSPPYFNAGVVGFPTTFAKRWLETALELDRPEHQLPQRRPWLDQIALPIAMRREGLEFRCLEDRFNLSLTHKDVEETPSEIGRAKIQSEIDRINSIDAAILHYHMFQYLDGLRYEGYLNDLLQEFSIFSDITEASWRKQLEFSPGEVKAEIARLKRIPKHERTEEQWARLKECEQLRHQFKRMKRNPDQFTNTWPDSILSKTSPASPAIAV